MRIGYRTSGTTSSILTFALTGIPERRKREKGAESLFEEIIAEKFPNLEKKNRYPGLGGIESTKQDEPKEVHKDK